MDVQCKIDDLILLERNSSLESETNLSFEPTFVVVLIKSFYKKM